MLGFLLLCQMYEAGILFRLSRKGPHVVRCIALRFRQQQAALAETLSPYSRPEWRSDYGGAEQCSAKPRLRPASVPDGDLIPPEV